MGHGLVYARFSCRAVHARLDARERAGAQASQQGRSARAATHVRARKVNGVSAAGAWGDAGVCVLAGRGGAKPVHAGHADDVPDGENPFDGTTRVKSCLFLSLPHR